MEGKKVVSLKNDNNGVWCKGRRDQGGEKVTAVAASEAALAVMQLPAHHQPFSTIAILKHWHSELFPTRDILNPCCILNCDCLPSSSTTTILSHCRHAVSYPPSTIATINQCYSKPFAISTIVVILNYCPIMLLPTTNHCHCHLTQYGHCP